MILYLDFETRCVEDIKVLGTARYAQECTPLLLGWAIDDAPARVHVFGRDWRPALVDALMDETAIVTAHNAMFDRAVYEAHLPEFPIALERWRCTQAKALSLSLPPSLDLLGKVLGLSKDERKLEDGKRLIKLFSVPRRGRQDFWGPEDKPEDWALFIEYCRQDVETMRRVDKLMPDTNYRGRELRLWRLDQRINDRGIPVDTELCRAVIRAMDRAKQERGRRLRELTQGAVTAGTQGERIRAWLSTYHGIALPDLTADTVQRTLAREDTHPAVREVLELRRAGSRTSTSKFQRILSSQTGGRVRCGYRFDGASRTRRWAGRDVQWQNLYRGTIHPVETLADAFLADAADLVYPDLAEAAASCIRPVIRAGDIDA